MGKDVFSAKICEKLINIKLLTVNYQLSTKFCNFALANQRRAPLCERQALFALLIVVWCNGSTTGFGSVCRGSNPRTTTFFLRNVHRQGVFPAVYFPVENLSGACG